MHPCACWRREGIDPLRSGTEHTVVIRRSTPLPGVLHEATESAGGAGGRPVGLEGSPPPGNTEVVADGDPNSHGFVLLRMELRLSNTVLEVFWGNTDPRR